MRKRISTILDHLLTLLRRPVRRRVPVLQQLRVGECGAACLAMILSYYGRKTTVAECREVLDAGRDGLSARAIAEAARACGLRVRAFSAEPDHLAQIRLPAVAHWQFNHFVVVEAWSPKSVTIVDPARGRRRLTAAEFGADFTGVILTFEPGVQFQPRRRAGGAFWLKYARSLAAAPGVRRVLVQVLLASLLLQVLGLALPAFTEVLVDQVLRFQLTDLMTVLGAGMVCVAAAQVVTSYLRSSLLIYLRGRLDSHLMLGFFEHLLALPFRYFHERASGDLLMRLGSNNLLREVFTSQTLSILLDGSLVLAYMLILLTQAPPLGLVVVGLGAGEVLILLGTRRRVRHLLQRELAAEAEEQGYTVEVLKGMSALKASGAEDRAFDRWSDLFFRQLSASLERDRLLALITSGTGALRTLSPLVLLWLGATLVLDGRMTLGTMLALNALAAASLVPLAALISSAQQLQLAGAHLERIADVLTAEPERAALSGRRVMSLGGRLDVRGVTFRYSAGAPDVLRDVSFHIAPGQKVAVVGPTGCGKSTLVTLLLGLYEPCRGEILYDGVPLRELDCRSLRGQIGVVLQEPFMFSGSIRQNITMNDPQVSMDEVVRVARLAGIHEEVSAMPMGYETFVAEGGATLSGGQRQRLAIARALVRHPALLVMDEATSHLDVRTEGEVDRNLSALACTRIVIAHRLSTIRNADLILVMDRGRIVEEGTHEELLARNGLYAELVNSSSERETDELAFA